MTTEAKEKVEVLNTFFTSVFISQTSYPQSTQLGSLGWGAELLPAFSPSSGGNSYRSAAPPGLSQVHGARWDPPEGAEGTPTTSITH